MFKHGAALKTRCRKVLTYLLPVIPATMVYPLPQQLNRRLGTIGLHHWHVYVINKEDEVLPCWRPKHTFSSDRKDISG